MAKKGEAVFFDVSKYATEVENASIQPSEKAAIFVDSKKPATFENKTERLNLLARPSTVKKVREFLQREKAAGHRSNGSLNELVNELLEKFVEEKGL